MTKRFGDRWQVVLTYRSNSGPLDIHHDLEEIEELQEIIERGPDWRTLIDARITLNPSYRDHSPTIEMEPRL
jgi:hypothetical protein